MNNTIGVIGCGWLGLPLAKKFIQDGFLVKGTTTSDEKLNVLLQEGIESYLIVLSETEIQGDIEGFFNGVTTLIINVPPKLRGSTKENYVSKMQLLHRSLQNTAIKNIVFVSSTSVYGNFEGVATEETIPNPDTESGKQLLDSERIFMDDKTLKTTIIRFGGLISEDRHPVTILSKRTHLKNGNHPVNLIHRKDCILIITAVIINNWWSAIINGVYPEHPTKKTYYTSEALKRGIKKPEYIDNSLEKGKIISSNFLLNVKNFQFSTSIKK